MPWVQLELSRAPFLTNAEKRDRVLRALDAVNGEELWHISAGGSVNAAPNSYAVDGRQYVMIQAGNVLLTFGLEDESE